MVGWYERFGATFSLHARFRCDKFDPETNAMHACKTALVAICTRCLAGAPALAAPQPGTSAPGQNKTGELFPPNEPMPMYRTGAGNPSASLYHSGGPAPNAGNTGLNGSAGTGYGWTPPATYGRMAPSPQR